MFGSIFFCVSCSHTSSQKLGHVARCVRVDKLLWTFKIARVLSKHVAEHLCDVSLSIRCMFGSKTSHLMFLYTRSVFPSQNRPEIGRISLKTMTSAKLSKEKGIVGWEWLCKTNPDCSIPGLSPLNRRTRFQTQINKFKATKKCSTGQNVATSGESVL